jgi:hypothetical protein
MAIIRIAAKNIHMVAGIQPHMIPVVVPTMGAVPEKQAIGADEIRPFDYPQPCGPAKMMVYRTTMRGHMY